MATHIEQAYQMLVDFTDFLFPGRPAPSVQTTVLQLRNHLELEDLIGKEGYAGFYVRRGVWGRPTMVAHGDLTDETRQTLYHEATHRILDHHARLAGPWLHEGLARYFESLTVRDGQARLGEIPDTIHIGPNGFQPYMLPGVKDLLTASYERFHNDDNPDRAKAPIEAANYTGAWGLVHLLNNGTEGYRPRFLQLLQALTTGASMAEAWQAGFAGVSLNTIEHHYRSHFAISDSVVFLTPYQLPKVKAPEVVEVPHATVTSMLTSIHRGMQRD